METVAHRKVRKNIQPYKSLKGEEMNKNCEYIYSTKREEQKKVVNKGQEGKISENMNCLHVLEFEGNDFAI